MVHKLVYKLPLHRCECGGKAELCGCGEMWFVGCDRFNCGRLVNMIFDKPLVAVLKWNLGNWRFTKQNKKLLNRKEKYYE